MYLDRLKKDDQMIKSARLQVISSSFRVRIKDSLIVEIIKDLILTDLHQ